MKKFSFTLQKLLDYKQQLLQKEKNFLAELRQRRDELIVEKEQTEATMLAANAKFRELMKKGLNTNSIIMHKQYMNDLNMRIKELIGLIEAADGRVEKQLAVVVSATQEVSTLEKLEEKQLEEYTAAFRKEEEKFIEEFVNNASYKAD